MFTHSDRDMQKKHQPNFWNTILISLLLMLISIPGKSQPYPVNITVVVLPSYTSKVNDYISQPNKIMVTLINTSPKDVFLYLQGSFTGEGGINVYTDPGFKMPQPIHLMPKGLFTLSQGNIKQVFDMNHVVFENITKNELIYGNGLPEGDYTICLRAFDYETNQPVSSEDQGCSPTFTVTDVEPPIVLQPVCDQEVIPKTPQNVIFTWTRPPGTPVTTKYDLKIIEVLPSDRNINDAIKSAVHPVFFESTLLVNSCLLGPADPQLVEGKKYAFTVTVIDPLNKTSYRNHGMSEVCSFIYRNPDFSPSLAQIKILTPEEGSVLNNNELPVFMWLSPFANVSVKGLVYQLKIAEITHAESKNVTIKKDEFFFLQKGIQGTTFPYPETGKPLESGKTYCWQVTAFSGSTEVGNSEVRTFIVK